MEFDIRNGTNELQNMVQNRPMKLRRPPAIATWRYENLRKSGPFKNPEHEDVASVVLTMVVICVDVNPIAWNFSRKNNPNCWMIENMQNCKTQVFKSKVKNLPKTIYIWKSNGHTHHPSIAAIGRQEIRPEIRLVPPALPLLVTGLRSRHVSPYLDGKAKFSSLTQTRLLLCLSV